MIYKIDVLITSIIKGENIFTHLETRTYFVLSFHPPRWEGGFLVFISLKSHFSLFRLLVYEFFLLIK